MAFYFVSNVVYSFLVVINPIPRSQSKIMMWWSADLRIWMGLIAALPTVHKIILLRWTITLNQLSVLGEYKLGRIRKTEDLLQLRSYQHLSANKCDLDVVFQFDDPQIVASDVKYLLYTSMLYWKSAILHDSLPNTLVLKIFHTMQHGRRNYA